MFFESMQGGRGRSEARLSLGKNIMDTMDFLTSNQEMWLATLAGRLQTKVDETSQQIAFATNRMGRR